MGLTRQKALESIMKLKETTGLILLLMAFTIAPFGYWINVKWAFVALVLAGLGALLFFTDRIRKRYSESDDVGSDIYLPKNHQLKGFHGSEDFDDSSHDHDID